MLCRLCVVINFIKKSPMSFASRLQRTWSVPKLQFVFVYIAFCRYKQRNCRFEKHFCHRLRYSDLHRNEQKTCENVSEHLTSFAWPIRTVTGSFIFTSPIICFILKAYALNERQSLKQVIYFAYRRIVIFLVKATFVGAF